MGQGQGGGGSRSQGVQTPSRRSKRGVFASPDTPKEEILHEIKDVLSGLILSVEMKHRSQRELTFRERQRNDFYWNGRGRSGIGESARDKRIRRWQQRQQKKRHLKQQEKKDEARLSTEQKQIERKEEWAAYYSRSIAAIEVALRANEP